MEQKDTLILGGHEFTSRFILGSGKYSVNLIQAAVEQAGAQIVTMALRRVEAGQKDNILDFIPKGRNPSSQHVGRPQRRRSRPHRPSVPRNRLRRLYQNRNHARF